MKRIELDENKIIGAIVVLENYIDGALSDYENGEVENTDVLEDCIYVHRKLQVASCLFCSITQDEYKERFKKVVKKNENI